MMVNNDHGQGDSINNKLSSWSFDKKVPENFDKHVSRSVPNYDDGHQLINIYSDFFINLPSKRVYDIGSSTGSLIERVQERHSQKDIEYFGIEPVKEMIEIAKKRDYKIKKKIKFINESILDVKLLSSSLVFSYYISPDRF